MKQEQVQTVIIHLLKTLPMNEISYTLAVVTSTFVMQATNDINKRVEMINAFVEKVAITACGEGNENEKI